MVVLAYIGIKINSNEKNKPRLLAKIEMNFTNNDADLVHHLKRRDKIPAKLDSLYKSTEQGEN